MSPTAQQVSPFQQKGVAGRVIPAWRAGTHCKKAGNHISLVTKIPSIAQKSTGQLLFKAAQVSVQPAGQSGGQRGGTIGIQSHPIGSPSFHARTQLRSVCVYAGNIRMAQPP